MGWNNPPVRWKDLARTLAGDLPPGDHGDSPAWSRHRETYQRPQDLPARGADDGGEAVRVPYAELHCHSNFSFLDGASHPEELVEEAARLQLDAIALTDHDGMYGVVRFAEAARELGVNTVFGTELSFGLRNPQNGVPDPEGEHLLLLARGDQGYRALCRAITAGQIHPGAEKGKPIYDLGAVAEEVAGQCVVLTGCRKGAVRSALVTHGPSAAAEQLRILVDRFGRDHVYVELTDHRQPLDSTHNDVLSGLAEELGLPTVATTAAHYARPERAPLADALAAIRARRGIDELEGWLPAAGTAFLRSGAEMDVLFRRYPGAVRRSALLGMECAFPLKLLAPKLPPFDVPGDHTETTYLRELTWKGAEERFGSKPHEEKAKDQIKHELEIIEELGFPGYFLIVWDIVRFCRDNNILCQGRGSAANSAVCYALGITKVDSVAYELLFERFLAPDRDGYPDIDLDIESDRREEAIQYVFAKHGRLRTAQVANVITYRARSAVRDAARALGYSPGQQDAWSKQIDRWGSLRSTEKDHDHDIPDEVVQLAFALEDFPRHLGIHSGGMVMCQEPVSQVVPVEWARMADRSVIQWEKEDCAAAGLVKFDLLGLGMLSALHYMIDLVRDYKDEAIDLAELDLADGNIYEMLCRADAIGVFQVESRAQLATLPRLQPREFYDLAVEVALIRPGPIQGGSVHPYIRRKQGREEWSYDHPLLEKALHKTKGVPLFQEQMMQIALDVANFTAAEADQLRHAMGSKRSDRKMDRLRQRFLEGAAANGVGDELAQKIFLKLKAFANFGFPESHALSFAHLVFSSAYFKFYHPDAFLAGLLRAQPMGFYSPQSLVADARRHGVTVHGPDINRSLPHATLEPLPDGGKLHAVRTGLSTVRKIGEDVANRITAERQANGDYRDLADVARRVRLTTPQIEALATAGAFAGFGGDRRQALWTAGAVAGERPEKLPGLVGGQAPVLPGMDGIDLAAADVWATGVSPDSYPTEFIRDHLDELGVVPASGLAALDDGARVLIGGAVTHRQRPATAAGVTFLNIEDETGMVNVICTLGLWQRYHRVARSSPALLIRGVVEKADGVVSVLADRVEPLQMRIKAKSRDFR
ncbi:error-prone DNA polymerase [Amycolatopsis sp. SID8362]|uniref:error-prone DNA polymerase n=1 Tax=Amycolatopsis sp. SID8362 TaxID=2690346 RepID=UPI00136D3AC1|nr:error-prone DNA polymerase [Amycolatopsis sp. SID8362]NBH05485.1 DNA polymerase III subunit alpha [Amycolatopsis sp. SID8362]NED42185.1 error-prone DNA polymerase [Amycolatopsis sp. SID8362]